MPFFAVNLTNFMTPYCNMCPGASVKVLLEWTTCGIGKFSLNLYTFSLSHPSNLFETDATKKWWFTLESNQGTLPTQSPAHPCQVTLVTLPGQQFRTCIDSVLMNCINFYITLLRVKAPIHDQFYCQYMQHCTSY